MSDFSKVILNQEPGAWAFEGIAIQLAEAFNVEVSRAPADINYVLFSENESITSFIPWSGIKIAADKRIQAKLFQAASVPTPKTVLVEAENTIPADLPKDVADWIIKYPTGLGANGHRFLDNGQPPSNWPKPIIVQEFIAMPNPEVYRLYVVSKELFGWNVRRFGEDTAKTSPWVSHANGAEYMALGTPPAEAVQAARFALQATGLYETFGCVDILQSDRGWLVLEVGTDGGTSYVDRDVPVTILEELNGRLAEAFQNTTPPNNL